MIADNAAKDLPALGVLGGTFDPIHNGHLSVARDLLRELHLSRLLFLISAHPPHKHPKELSSWEDRLEMLQLAIQDNPHFAVSEVENQRSGPSYTFETMAVLQSRYGRHYRIFFIVGADSILDIRSWRQPEGLLESGRLVVVPRPGFDLGRLDPKTRERVTIVETPLVEISSSDIRQRVNRGKSIRGLVPPAVEAYIHRRGLYRNLDTTE